MADKKSPIDFEFRMAQIEARGIDEEARSVEVIISSEAPAEMGFGYPEVLVHSTKAVDLTRLKTVAGVLFNHNPNQIVASIQKAWIDTKERVGRALIKFDEDVFAQEIFGKVKSGSLKGVSVGYMIAKNGVNNIPEGEKKDGFEGPVRLVTKWEPFEFSLTPIPMDRNAMIERKAEIMNRMKAVDENGPAEAGEPSRAGKPTQEASDEEETRELEPEEKQAEPTPEPESESGAEDRKLGPFYPINIEDVLETFLKELGTVKERAEAAGCLGYGIDLYLERKSVDEISTALIERMKAGRIAPVPPVIPSEEAQAQGKKPTDRGVKEIVERFR